MSSILNKRILELWEQSADKFPHGIKTNPEKFAELILNEVLIIADNFELEVNRSGLVDSIKQHFKVE